MNGTLTIATAFDRNIIMRSTDEDNYCLITMENSSGTQLSYLGYTGTTWTIDGQEILTGRNYSSHLDLRYYTESESDSRFVNVTGDTMRGQLLISSIGTSYDKGALQIRENNFGGALNGNNNEAPRITFHWSSRYVKDFGMNRYGHPMWDGYMIWHEGNDGSGSKLDADLLDGHEGEEYVRSFFTSSPGYDCDTINYYPFISFTYSNNAPFNGGFIDVSAHGYGFYLGTDYRSNQPLYYRRHAPKSDGGIGGWQQLARVTDNVASATKLQSSRTINGTYFDGTSNITTSYWGTARTINGTSINGSTNYVTSYWGTARTFYINSHNSYSPGAGISVNGSGDVTLYLPTSISCSYWFRSTGNTGWYSETYGGGIHMLDSTYVRIYNNKRFYVANSDNTNFSGNTAIHTNGGIYASKNITTSANVYAEGAITARASSSDINLKTDIKDFSALSLLRKTKPKQFLWNDAAKALSPIFNNNFNNYGLIAQELQEVPQLAHFVTDCFKDYLAINYERFIPILIQSTKEIDNEQTKMKREIYELKKEVIRLNKVVASLTA